MLPFPSNQIPIGAYREKEQTTNTGTGPFLEVQGAYPNDTAARLGGLVDGDCYEMTLPNTYGLPQGTLKLVRLP